MGRSLAPVPRAKREAKGEGREGRAKEQPPFLKQLPFLSQQVGQVSVNSVESMSLLISIG